ncbi:protein ZINC INDUCED FACILITATOR-LIKE 1-like [Xenia sp. Carnegie-2017]|uniref:protein ZINC INDUCED FACILITATOR-LIKE 1-like n=1 Tax=Xenia sp. Carnegie-2017 TaxID=2897299 RepID=UPI001F03361B|nr:protein ZINC INDUCED FACILITATOR-LIKE 1-like [Xenia sp. Carnegie-2017]
MLSIAMFFTVVLPSTSILLYSGVVLKVVIIIVMILIRVAQGCCFTGQFIMLNNCVTSDLRATAHGLAMTAVCAARAISPTVSGSMFSWSITSGLNFPFNEKFVFIFLGFIFYLTIIILCCVDESAVSKHCE